MREGLVFIVEVYDDENLAYLSGAFLRALGA
jgi:hypothetical protein